MNRLGNSIPIKILTRRSFSSTSKALSSKLPTKQPSKQPMTATNELQFGWPISERIIPETIPNKMDVWTAFSPASGFVPKESLNLGQGFMNWAPPKFLQDALKKATDSVEANHYSIPRGRIRLRKALSDYMSASFRLPGGRALDPASEIVVTAGANEGTYAFATAFILPGDEVILFEPFFDQYTAQVTFNGGVPVFVPIRPPAAASNTTVSSSEWKVDLDELRAAITPKTKMIWINTPHNPIGKVFDEEELRGIGNIAEEHNLLILADEVYDCLTFDGKPHVRVASIDNFWKRTLTVGSAGKSFASTGWRIGWVVGPSHLVQATLAASTRIVFSCNSPAQEAVGEGLELALKNGFFDTQVQEYQERRDLIMKGLDELGLPYTIPEGAYFVLVNTARLEIPEDFKATVPDMISARGRDWLASWFIAETALVVSIPPSDFYSSPHWDLADDYIRLAFCKDLGTIKAATDRLLKLKPFIRKE